jgi:arylsulfatase
LTSEDAKLTSEVGSAVAATEGLEMLRVMLFALAFLPIASAAPLSGRKPNVIIILTDDQGYGDLSCHGNPVLKTPHLDRLHRESARFTDFHVSPTCAPTRSSLLSGKHEFKNGITHTINERERMSLKTFTLAESLRNAGYATGIFGKWHLGDEDAYQPGRRGFDEVFIHGAGGIGQAYPGTTCGDAPGNSYFNPFVRHNGVFVKADGYCTDVFFRQAKSWISAAHAEKRPFFAWIATNAPHAPLQVRPEDEAKYKGQVPDATAKFFGMIANIDDNVGALLDHLKEKDLERDTLVIFMNDNGGTAGVKLFNAGMRAQKGTPYRGGTRGACFCRWPGTIAPGDRPQLAAHIDLFPTLAAIAGAAVPEAAAKAFDGRSLVPVLEDASAAWAERFLFTHVGRWAANQAVQSKYANCSVRWKEFNLVNAPGKASKKSWALYDLKADIAESKDLVAEKPEVVRTIEAAYDAWWTSVLPCLENESVPGAKVMPFHVAFEKQFGKMK